MQHKFGYSFNTFLQKLYMSQFQIYYLIFKLYTPNQFISFFMAIIENCQILSLFLTNDVEYIFFNIFSWFIFGRNREHLIYCLLSSLILELSNISQEIGNYFLFFYIYVMYSYF